jgi:hypothetical protein
MLCVRRTTAQRRTTAPSWSRYPGEKTPFAVAHTDAARGGGQPIEFAENI